jgi:hypothetical protein
MKLPFIINLGSLRRAVTAYQFHLTSITASRQFILVGVSPILVILYILYLLVNPITPIHRTQVFHFLPNRRPI